MTEDIQGVFNEIAPGWYNFRHRTRFGSELEMLAGRWQKGRLLNVGCAHGPDFLPFRQNFEIDWLRNTPGNSTSAPVYLWLMLATCLTMMKPLTGQSR